MRSVWTAAAVGMLFFANGVFAADSDPCVEKQVRADQTTVFRRSSPTMGCIVEVSPRFTPDLTFRSYLIDSRGMFMAFSSVPGPEDISAGARAFFLFPRKKLADFEVRTDGTIGVTMASGTVLSFSASTSRIRSISDGARVEEDEKVSMENNGGVEIFDYPGILLDTGWQLAEVGHSQPNRISTLKDGHGRSCSVRNSELFNYVAGEPIFKFPTDPGLAAFLAKRCPELDVTPLENPSKN